MQNDYWNGQKCFSTRSIRPTCFIRVLFILFRYLKSAARVLLRINYYLGNSMIGSDIWHKYHE